MQSETRIVASLSMIMFCVMVWANFELKLPEERWDTKNLQGHIAFDEVSKPIKNLPLFLVNMATFALSIHIYIDDRNCINFNQG